MAVTNGRKLVGVCWCLILAPTIVQLARTSAATTSKGLANRFKDLDQPPDEETQPSLEELEALFDQRPEARNAVNSPTLLWPNRTIPYQVGDEFAPEQARTIHEALGYFGKHTCVGFEEYDERRHSGQRQVLFRLADNFCGTLVGFQPRQGPHLVQLNPSCAARTAVVQHEVLHVLGLHHEHRRPDRGDHVRIEYLNIRPQYWSQFTRLSDREVTTYGVPYDFGSVMHYPENAFAIDPSRPTIVAWDGVARAMGNTERPSEGDLAKIRLMYKC